MPYYQQLLILCPLIFFSGFVDSIAGGGALISLPAYYTVGLTPQMALGTNKFSALLGCTTSSIRFIKNKSYEKMAILPSMACALIGSPIGARLAIYLSDEILKYILIICIPVLAVFIITRKEFSETAVVRMEKKKILALCGGVGFIVGMYDGFFGPGAGTFMILLYTSIGFSLSASMGTAKLVNFATNISAMAVYLFYGKINFALAIPAAVSAIVGNFIGSGLAIKNGKKIVRPMMIIVLALLLIKVVYDTFLS